MAATEISRTKDAQRGLIVVQFDDGHGSTVPHTVAVLNVPDVAADIESARLRIEQQADAKALAFEQAGL